jgi:hypothetical protein
MRITFDVEGCAVKLPPSCQRPDIYRPLPPRRLIDDDDLLVI